MKREKNEKRAEASGPVVAAASNGVPISYVKLEPTPGDPTNTAYASQYISIDAAPGLDQGIEPKWAGAHTFLKGVGFAPDAGSPSQATLDLSGQSFTYSVTSGTTHDFLVDKQRVGRIDDPQNPGEDDSLVARKYVQDYVADNGGGGAKPGPPTSKVELQSKDGSLNTYMRSDATLALDLGISPEWTGNHTFDNQASFKGGVGFQDGASINTDSNGIAYDVDDGKIHEFYVGGSEVGRIDDPQNPGEDDSLVARKYVQDYVTAHGGSVTRSMDMVVSQGSPKVEKGGNLAPANVVVVYGPSGVNFRITVDNGATIEGDYEPGGSGEFFQIQDGKAQFRIQMPPDSTNFESTVTVVPNVTQDDSVVAALAGLGPMRRTSAFFPMQSPSSDNENPFIESYAATGNVPADGTTESEIYVIADASQASEVWMTVTGRATFDNGSNKTKIPLAADGSAVGKVSSPDPGAIAVTIGGPDNIKEKVNVYPIFVNPPVVG